MFLCLLILAGVPAANLGLIPSTPENHPFPVKISLLQCIESRHFANQAEKIIAGVKTGDLIHTWKMALYYDPGNAENHRALLKSFITHDRKRLKRQDAKAAIDKALKITGPNPDDLELAASVYDHYRLSQEIIDLYQHNPNSKSVQLERLYLDTLLTTGMLAELGEAVSRAAKNPLSDPVLELFYQTFDDSSGTPQWSDSLGSRLEAASQDEATAATALRLRMQFAFEDSRTSDFATDLEALQQRFDDTVWDHLRYWQLLEKTGHGEQAVELAKRHAIVPKSSDELNMVGETFVILGLHQAAYKLLNLLHKDFEFSERTWWLMSQILIERQDWRSLQRLAIQLREAENVTKDYTSLSRLLSIWAWKALDRPGETLRLVEALHNSNIINPRLALYVASQLHALKESELASSVLTKHRSTLNHSEEFWDLSYRLALKLRQRPSCLLAAENLYRLAPDDDRHRSSYAMQLALAPNRSSEALDLISSVGTDQPDSGEWLLAQGIALIKLDRMSEAAQILESLGETTLTPTWRNRYLLAVMQIKYSANMLEEAFDTGIQIDTERLLPEDLAVFKSMWNELELNLSFEPQESLTQASSN